MAHSLSHTTSLAASGTGRSRRLFLGVAAAAALLEHSGHQHAAQYDDDEDEGDRACDEAACEDVDMALFCEFLCARRATPTEKGEEVYLA